MSDKESIVLKTFIDNSVAINKEVNDININLSKKRNNVNN